MRHPLVPALVVVLALVCYAILGAVVAGAVAPVSNATVSGTVTDDDGRPVTDAAVLLEPAEGDLLVEHTDGDRAVIESVRKLAAADPDGVTVVHTDEDGHFSASVPEGRYRAVAVTRERISRLRTVDAAGGATVDLAVGRHRVLRVDAETTGPVAPGNATTLAIRVENHDDEPVRSLSVTVGDLPASWTLSGVDADGHYDADARRIAWDQLDPNETAVVRLHVEIPDGSERDRYPIPVSAGSDSHFVEDFDDGAVVVRPANATATPTVHPGGRGETDTDRGETYTPTGGDNGATPTPSPHVDRSLPVPGLDAGAALAGFAVALVLTALRS